MEQGSDAHAEAPVVAGQEADANTELAGEPAGDAPDGAGSDSDATAPETNQADGANTPDANEQSAPTQGAGDAPAADDDKPAYADWAEAAAAIESGDLAGDGFKPAGTGSESDPYVIATPEAFAWWAAEKAGQAGTFARLDADIDLTSRALGGSGADANDPLPWPGDASLAGQLDGAAHSVVFRTQGAGLFGQVAETGAARWLTLGEPQAAADERAAADKPAAGTFAATTRAGSLAGINKGTVEGVVNLAPVRAGDADDGAGAQAAALAGGIVGENDGRIADCANLGAVENASGDAQSAAAGIAGAGMGTIATSYSAGSVRAAANGAYLATALTSDDAYEDLVDAASCYLAPGEEGATYEGIALERDGALTAADLTDAAERLNDGRAPEACPWSAGDETTRNLPAPSKPANPDAAASPQASTLSDKTYNTWYNVGQAVCEKTLTGTYFLPTGTGTQSDPYVVRTPEALGVLSYAYVSGFPIPGISGGTAINEAHIVISPAVFSLDMFGAAYCSAAPDYDADGNLRNPDDAVSWIPFGGNSAGAAFTGSFDGNECVISSLSNGDTDYAGGLFGEIKGATIRNVHLGKSSYIQGRQWTGGIVGHVVDDSKPSNIVGCTNEATIVGVYHLGVAQYLDGGVGGIVGMAEGTSEGDVSITSCTNSGSIKGDSTQAGGIVGRSSLGTISRCTNSGSVESTIKESGGIVGAGTGTKFQSCINNGSVTGIGMAGGIAGTGDPVFKECGNSGSVTANTSGGSGRTAMAGGIEGSGPVASADPTSVTDCYNTGIIKAVDTNPSAGDAQVFAGGLLGTMGVEDCTVTNSYNAGAVIAPAGAHVAAFAGAKTGSSPGAGLKLSKAYCADGIEGSPVESFEDKAVAGFQASSLEDMKSFKFAAALNGGKYIGDTAGTASTTWTADAQKNGAGSLKNGGFPVFGNLSMFKSWEEVGKAVVENTGGMGSLVPDMKLVTFGDGATDTAYIIDRPEQLAWFAYRLKTYNSVYCWKSVQLAADLDLSGFEYSGADEVGTNFANCLQWAPIGSYSQQFMGRFDGAGHQVKNMRIDVSAGAKGAGFFGYAGQKVERLILASGFVNVPNDSSIQFVGTLAGISGSFALENCASLADIECGSEAKDVGGLTGSWLGDMTNCYYAGSASSTVKRADNSLSGPVVSKVYYDKEKNPEFVDYRGITGKTTAELQSAAMAADLSSNGATWSYDWLNRNNGYPVLVTDAAPAAPSTWEEVGKAVAEGAGSMGAFKPSEQAVTWSDGSKGTAYVIDKPEQLAWFSYMVKTDEAAYGAKNVQLAADLDLSGFAYSGKSEAGSNYENCLPWLPIGRYDYGVAESSSVGYTGRFDGAGYLVRNLHLVNEGRLSNGLFGLASEGHVIERVGLVSGCMTGKGGAGTATLVGGRAESGTIRNCFSRVDIADEVNAETSSTLTYDVASKTSLENCYYAGRVSSANSVMYPVTKAYPDYSPANVYYDTDAFQGSVLNICTDLKGLPTTAFKTWIAAVNLNGSTSKAWRTDTDNVNDGYPVLCKAGESLGGTWQDVGEYVDDDGADKPGGSGTEASPYLIGTPEQLAWWAYKVNTENANFVNSHVKLTKDISLLGSAYNGNLTEVGEDWDNCLRWIPVSTFSGAFDGDGHTISDVRIQDGNNRGFFNTVKGQLKNFTLGGGYLCGRNIGGITRILSGADASVTDVVSTMTLRASLADNELGMEYSEVGGIAYRVENGARIERCGNKGIHDLRDTSNASMSTNGRDGGIAAVLMDGCAVRDCYNTGSITFRSALAGGLVGYNSGTVENCFNTGSITKNLGKEFKADIANNINGGTIRNCYSSTNYTSGDLDNADGSVQLRHLTTAQMQTRGFAFNLNGNVGGADTVWTWNTGDTYPTYGHMDEATWLDVGEFVANDGGTFAAYKPTMGDGKSQATAVQLSTPEALAWYSYLLFNNKTPGAVKLTADIDLTGSYVASGKTPWVPMRGVSDSGAHDVAEIDFEGDGHTVSNMSVMADSDRDSYTGAGLFGHAQGSLSGVVLADSSVTGAYSVGPAAGLVGSWRSGTIARCGVAPSVSIAGSQGSYGNWYCTAGLVGECYSSGSFAPAITIENCWSRAAVSGQTNYVGGLIGYDSVSTTVKNCYSAPKSLTGGAERGIVVGGAMGAYEGCYWLSEGYDVDSGITGDTNMAKTDLEFRSPQMAFLLNNGATGADAAWTWDPFKNDRYPSLGTPPEDAVITTWAQVGARQSEDKLRRTEVNVDADGFGEGAALRDAQPSDGSYLPALSGSGTADDPYVLNTPEAFAWWGNQVNTNAAGKTHDASGSETAVVFNSCYAGLGASVDLGGWAYQGKTPGEPGDEFANCLAWVPVGGRPNDGYLGDWFLGSFDGRDHGVANMRVEERPFKSGLFGAVANTTIKGVHVLSGFVRGMSRVGGIVGQVGADTTEAGGSTRIEGCSNAATVVCAADPGPALHSTGGIVGFVVRSKNLTIQNCSNSGDVSSASEVGGILGYSTNQYVLIQNSYNTGSVSTGQTDASKKPTVGGIAGKVEYLTLNNCYSAGKVADASGGALVADSGATVVNSYYANDVGSVNKVDKGQGVTSDQLRSWGAAYALSRGDGRMDTNPTKLTTWRQASGLDENGGFPVLISPDAPLDEAHLQPASNWGDVGLWVDVFAPDKKPAEGSLTFRDGETLTGYEITTPEQLAWLATQETDDYMLEVDVRIKADIDLSGYAYTGNAVGTPGAHYENCLSWMPIGIDDKVSDKQISYRGRFDGGGHPIDNLRIVGSAKHSGGLFGSIAYATVENVALRSGAVDLSEGVHTASLVGYADSGKILNCYSNVDVVAAGASLVGCGALLGETGMNIYNCYYAGIISSDSAPVPVALDPYDVSISNVLYTNGTDDTEKMQNVTSDQLASWGAAYQLNVPLAAAGTQKPVGSLNTWRMAASADENHGFPVLLTDEEITKGDHMTAASNWGDVGLWVDAFGTDDASDKTRPLRPQQQAAHTWRDGAKAAAYQLASPEQLAWLAYMVNEGVVEGLAAADQNAFLASNIDLSGYAYTGNPTDVPGEQFENCLEWEPIGADLDYTSVAGEVYYPVYRGRFDGRGRTVQNLRLTSEADDYGDIGFFGCCSGSSVVERLGLVSGALDVQKALSDNIASFVGMAQGSIADCYSLVNVGGAEASYHVGGFMGNSDTAEALVANCYYGGDHGKFFGKWEYGEPNDTLRNAFLLGSQLHPAEDWSEGSLMGVTSEQLQSWGVAYQLNVGSEKSLGDLTTWRQAKSASENKGYPVLFTDDEIASGGHMTAASNWGDVGLWVDEFATDKKPAEVSGAYSITAPEQLAWFAYKVNTDNAAFGAKNAVLTASIDLFGTAFTGKKFDAGADLNTQLTDNALPWVPIGDTQVLPDRSIAALDYAGTLDGRGNAVSHMVTSPGIIRAGLVGNLTGTVSDVAVGASLVRADDDASTDSQRAGGSVAGHLGVGGLVERCSAAGDVTVSAPAAGGIVGEAYGSPSKYDVNITSCYSRAGVEAPGGAYYYPPAGIVSAAGSVSVANCYFAGKATMPIVGRSEYLNSGSGNYYLDTSYSSTDSVWSTGSIKLTSDQLASWGAAYALGGGDGEKSLDEMTTWRAASGPDDNGGFPVLVAPGAPVDDAHLQPASNWGDVGLWVDAFAPDKKPAEGDGTEANPYVLSTPEALAWWGHMVNHHNREYTRGPSGAETGMTFYESHVRVSSAIDLAGLAYTGSTDIGENHAGCLEWSPVSYYDGSVEVVFNGVFDGGGYPISNVRLVGRAENNVGFFGDFESAPTIKRVLLASGTLDATGPSAGWQVGTFVAYAAGGTISDSASFIDVVGSAGAGDAFGGLVGSVDAYDLENCYYGGSIDAASPAKPFAGELYGGFKAVNCYYVGDDAADPSATGLSSDQLASWGAAYQLNAPLAADDSQKPLGSLNTWRMAASADENHGFPVLLTDDEIAASGHMTAASNWGDVGAWVDVFAPNKKPAGDGTEAGPYVLGTPEALAWWGHMVNHRNGDRTLSSSGAETSTAYGSSHAHVSAALDLAGAAYTGASSIGANHANCLAWSPIGDSKTSEPDDDVAFTGSFNGGGYAINNLRLVGGANSSLGLLGLCKDGAVVQRVMLASGTMDITDVPEYGRPGGDTGRGGTVVSEALGITVNDCASLVDVVGTAKVTYGIAGIAGWVNGSTLKSCYYGGTITAGSHVSGVMGPFNSERPTTSNLFYVGEDVKDSFATALTAEQLQSWGAAYALNVGEAKALADLDTWRQAKDEGENKGYPVLLTDDEIADGSRMTAASNWGDVGAWVDAFATDKKPAGSGSTADPYQIGSSEAFAWLAYKVNANGLADDRQNAQLAADVDLAGAAYTGNIVPGEDFSGCLAWSPIGYDDFSDGSVSVFEGRFDGQGHAVENLLLEASRRIPGGLFGNTGASSAIVRTGIASGAVARTELAEMWGTLVGLSRGEVSDCYSRADLLVPGPGDSTIGSLVGSVQDGAVERCYYAGSNALKLCVGEVEGGTVGPDVYFVGDAADDPNATAIAADRLASWGAAYQLNVPLAEDGTQKELDSLTTWRPAKSASENNGFPVLLTTEEVAEGGHMGAASDWGDVGAWVDSFAPAQKPAEVGAPASWGKPEGTKAYSITDPAQLAWFAYAAPAGGGSTPNVLVTQSLDLAGNVYTGKSGTGTNYDACLEWKPSYLSGSVFDGGSQVVKNLYQKKNQGGAGGLFTRIENGATVRNVGLESGLVWIAERPGGPVGAVTSNLQASTIENCFSRVSVKNDSEIPAAAFVGYARDSVIDNCYFAGSLSGDANRCIYDASGSTGTLYTDQDVTDAPGIVTKMTTPELKSWRAAYLLNGKTYVGSNGSGLPASTVWTTDSALVTAQTNGGYPVFGNLNLGKLKVELDPADVLVETSGAPAKKASGKFTTPLGAEQPLTGQVTLLEAPDVSGMDGGSLVPAGTVDANFSAWGATSANAQVALVAGTTSLAADTSADTVLSMDGLDSLDLHAAAAYIHGSNRTAKIVVMDAMGGYEVEVAIKGVSSKSLDVTVPVETSFSLEPDGTAHTGDKAAKASTASKVASNNGVPVAGEVKKITALAEGTSLASSDKQVNAVLTPASASVPLTNNGDPITDANQVKLFAAEAGADPDLTPFAPALYYDPSKGTVPLYFAMPGNQSVAWKWGLDYTGSYIGEEGVFGYTAGYAFGLPTDDVSTARLSGSPLAYTTL